MRIVRPFPARVVRSDSAGSLVRALVDPLEVAASQGSAIATDPAAYEESAAALYVYRQGAEGSPHTGLVCEVALSAFVDGRVRLHEAVQPDRVEALVQHHARTNDPPALVALLHRPGEAFARTLDEVCRTPPILDVAGPGPRRTLWRVTVESTADALTSELAAAVLYVADGHHRVAAALEAWRSAGHRTRGPGRGARAAGGVGRGRAGRHTSGAGGRNVRAGGATPIAARSSRSRRPRSRR